MEKVSLTLEGGRICCRRFGYGPEVILALHGFGTDGSLFASLGAALASDYTIYAPDLPFHGESRWERPVFKPADLDALREALLEVAGATYCRVLGYSMGARLLLSTAGSWSASANHVLLLAPDGLGTRGMAIPERIPAGGRRLLARWLRNPAPVLRLAQFLHRSGRLDPFSFFYLKHHLSREDRLSRLLQTWISLASFAVNISDFRQVVAREDLKVEVIIGNNDPLVDPGRVARHFQEMPGMRIHYLDADHILLSGQPKDQIADIIRAFL